MHTILFQPLLDVKCNLIHGRVGHDQGCKGDTGGTACTDRHMWHWHTKVSISLVIPSHHKYILARFFILVMPEWPSCNWWRTASQQVSKLSHVIPTAHNVAPLITLTSSQNMVVIQRENQLSQTSLALSTTPQWITQSPYESLLQSVLLWLESHPNVGIITPSPGELAECRSRQRETW